MTDLRDVATAIPFDGEQFLVVKREMDKNTFPGRWEFPAGWVEDKEEPRDTALRELEEETALLGTVLRTGEPHVVETNEGPVKVHPYLVMVERSEPVLSEEHTAYQWLDLADLPGLESVDGFLQDLRAVDVKVDEVDT